MKYMLLGMPRSRTAWFSAFLSDGNVCTHEGINRKKSIDHYISSYNFDIEGDSTTAAKMLDAKKINCKKVVILDNPVNSKRKLDKAFGIDSDINDYLDLHDYLSSIDCPCYDLSEIDKNIEDIWYHLKGYEMDFSRYNSFKDLDIQVRLPYYFDNLSYEQFKISQQNN